MLEHGWLSFFDRLGMWTMEPHRKWEWYYIPAELSIYRWKGCYFQIYRRVPPSHRFEIQETMGEPLPAGACRATADFDHWGRVCLRGWAGDLEQPSQQNQSLDSLILATKDDDWVEWPQILSGQEGVAMVIANGTALAVCDGSYMPQARQDLGSASWVIECGQLQEHCHGVIQTSGETDDVNAYWSELQGIHELLTVIEAICTIYKITSGRIQLGCDNKKVVWLSSTYLPQLSSHTKHVKVWAIRALVQSIPVTIDFQHIDGHQDEKIPFHQLNRMAQLNVWMDEEAKCYLRYLISLPSAPSLPQTIYKEGWSCWVGGMKVMTNPSDLIKHAVYGRELHEWLHQ